MTTPTYRGACLCGTVQYQVDGDIHAVSHCHCSMCRKAHGAAFATYGSVPLAAFRFTQGEASVRSHASSPGTVRRFCGNCGSPLTWHQAEGAYPDWMSFTLGTLETPFASDEQRHIHVASKAPWYSLEDHWPQSD